MAEHTPGPWAVGKWGDVEAGDGFIVASPNGTPDGDFHANARLIAAAPTMADVLEAVEWAAGVCPSCAGVRGEGDHYADCALHAALVAAGRRE